MSSRVHPHSIADKAENIFRDYVTDIDIIYRNITGRDYGVDGIVEIFEQGNPTGKIAFVQIKGTENAIVPGPITKEISCKSISKSNLNYIKQNYIPVILVYVSVKRKMFYYKILNKKFEYKNNYKTIIRMNPNDYINEENKENFYNCINEYYDTITT